MSLRGREKLIDESFFFVTTSVINHSSVFIYDECCDILISNIKHYQTKYNFEILSYVIMPTHFHWIVQIDKSKGTISDIMRDIKKYSAWDIMEILENKNRFDLINKFEKHASDFEYKDRKRKFWQHRFDDQVIRDQKMFWIKLNYIHNNPVKAGFAVKQENYKYSSARNYILQDHSIIFVNTEMMGIIIK
ncbi:MAG: transposase [Ignavibacteriae bacterium]|nr:transposase [Ignavibacteriota bacterium]